MSIEKAMSAVFTGPEVKKLKVYDHEFNVKPADITRNGTQVTANGQISHHLSHRKDDQVYYTILKEGDEVKTLDVKIARGGHAAVVAPIISAVSTIIGKPLPASQIEEAGRWLGKQIDGSWEEVAEVLVANIALRL